MPRTARPRPRADAFPPEMLELMECHGDVHFTVAGVAGRGLLALGHGAPGAIIAAFDTYARRSWGVALAGEDAITGDMLLRTWAKPVTDCGRTGNMAHGSRDCEACAAPDWAGEYRVPHVHHCWLCAAIKDSPWWWTGLFDKPGAQSPRAGYLPVTVWRDPADVELELSWSPPAVAAAA